MLQDELTTPAHQRLNELEQLIAGECSDMWTLASWCAEYYDLSVQLEEY